jgi:hypothetical protein
LGDGHGVLSPALGSTSRACHNFDCAKEIQHAQQIGAGSEREREFIRALGMLYQDATTVPYRTRASNYEHAMGGLAAQNRQDVEAQVF